MESLNNFKHKLEKQEKRVYNIDFLDKKTKENILIMINKLEDIIFDIEINSINDNIINKNLKLHLNTFLKSIDKLIKGEIKNIDPNIINNIENFLNSYKKFAILNSSFSDNIKGYYLGTSYGLDKLKNYIKDDIESLIEFFSNIENVTNLPESLSNIIKNIDKIADNLGDNLKNLLNNYKYEIISLEKLHNNNEISDKSYLIKYISSSIFILGVLAYEFFPLSKISKIKTMKEFEDRLLEHIEEPKKKIKLNIEDVKQKAYDVLSYNFPLLEIERIVPNSKLINFNFGGIKTINDKYGQATTDILVNLVKKSILEQNNFKYRKIRDNYKNLTLNVLEYKNINFNINIEDIIINNKEIFGFKSEIQLKEFIYDSKKNFKIGIGESLVENGNIENKLYSFYQAEIASKLSLNNKGEIRHFSLEDIKETAEEIFKIEKHIIQKYKNMYFIVNGNKFKAIIKNISGEETINPILLKYVRKGKKIKGVNGKLLENLQNEIEKYLNTINKGFDFIAPYFDFKREVKLAKEINEQIRLGKVNIEKFIYTYKGAIPKELFKKVIDGKKGSLHLIDIKDMGIMNLQEFREVAKKLVKGEKVDLTSTGKQTTEKFIKFVEEIKRKYPESYISIGGDEIFIFNKTNLEEKLGAITDKVGLNARITRYSGIIRANHIDMLDNKTIIMKQVEEGLEQIILSEKITGIILKGGNENIRSNMGNIFINKEQVRKLLKNQKIEITYGNNKLEIEIKGKSLLLNIE